MSRALSGPAFKVSRLRGRYACATDSDFLTDAGRVTSADARQSVSPGLWKAGAADRFRRTRNAQKQVFPEHSRSSLVPTKLALI